MEAEERREEMGHGLMRVFHPERRVMRRWVGAGGVGSTEVGGGVERGGSGKICPGARILRLREFSQVIRRVTIGAVSS